LPICRFERLKQKSEIHSVIRHEEVSSAKVHAAGTEFSVFMQEKGYLPQQMFHADETGLLGKRCLKEDAPSRMEMLSHTVSP
jgi:hypothetical protein